MMAKNLIESATILADATLSFNEHYAKELSQTMQILKNY